MTAQDNKAPSTLEKIGRGIAMTCMAPFALAGASYVGAKHLIVLPRREALEEKAGHPVTNGEVAKSLLGTAFKGAALAPLVILASPALLFAVFNMRKMAEPQENNAPALRSSGPR